MKIDIILRTPWEPRTELHDLLKPFCDYLIAHSTGSEIVYTVDGLRIDEIIMDYARMRRGEALTEHAIESEKQRNDNP